MVNANRNTNRAGVQSPGGSPSFPMRWLLAAVLGLWLAVPGCGGTSGTSGHASPPPGPPGPAPEEPIPDTGGEEFNVTITTRAGQFYVDDLEVEFNRRRGIHAFYGFYRDAYDKLVTVPFRDLARVDFLGPMPISLFDQAIVGREQMNIQEENAFEVRLTYKDLHQEQFFAIIPKLRGEKDFTLWELNLTNANNAGGIDYIEFNR